MFGTIGFGFSASGSGGGGGGLTSISANNGLSATTISNTQLGSTTNTGSPLIHDTFINLGNYELNVNGGALANFNVNVTDTGVAQSNLNIDSSTIVLSLTDIANNFTSGMDATSSFGGAGSFRWFDLGSGLYTGFYYFSTYLGWSVNDTTTQYNYRLPDAPYLANSVLADISGDGVLTWASISSIIPTITADNGLTNNTGTNIQLGGTLIQGTTIVVPTTTYLYIQGSNAEQSSPLSVTNDGYDGYGVFIQKSNVGVGLYVYQLEANLKGVEIRGDGAIDGIGYFINETGSTNYIGLNISSQGDNTQPILIERLPKSGSAIESFIKLKRSDQTVTPYVGMGGSIDFQLTDTTSTYRNSNSIISKLSDPSDASFTSQFEITGVSSAVESTIFTLEGTGQLQLNNYGIGTFTGTATYNLSVDASGNIIETTASTSSVTADNGLNISSGSNVQLGGTLLKNTSINTATYYLSLSGTLANNSGLFRVSATGSASTHSAAYFNMSGSGIGVKALSDGVGVSAEGVLQGVVGTSTAGVGGGFYSTSGIGAIISCESSHALQLTINPSSFNDVKTIIKSYRFSTGTAADGIGASFDFYCQDSTGAQSLTNKLVSKWSTASSLTRTSQFEITSVNSAVESTTLTLKGTGQLQLNKYVSGAFSGTAVNNLAVDSSGNIITIGTSTSISADNGLTISSGSNVQLGGTLLKDTAIDNASFFLKLEGALASANGIFRVKTTGGASATDVASYFTTNIGVGVHGNSTSGTGVKATGTTYGLYATGTTGYGVYGTATSGYGGYFASTSNYGAYAESTSGLALALAINPSTTNSVSTIANIIRGSSGTASDGIGGSFDFYVEDDSGTANLTNKLISKWSKATNVGRISQFEITGGVNGVDSTLFTLKGTGQLQLNKYGSGTFTGTAAYSLAVDSNGNVIELSASGTYVPYTGATASVNLGTNNLSANHFFNGFTSVAASGTTITLTIASTPEYTITGSGGQVIQLPDATTLAKGTIYSFNNNQSSGAITVNNNSGTLIVSIPSGGYVDVLLLDNTPAAGSWDRHFQAPSNVSWSTNTLDTTASITSATWNGVAVALNRGGTNANITAVNGGVIYSTASAMAVTSAGTTGQVLTSNGAAAPTWVAPALATYKNAADTVGFSSTSNTAVYTQLIAANTYTIGDILRITYRSRKTGTAGIQTLRIYVNATADLSGSPILVGRYGGTAANTIFQMQRHLAIKSSTTNTEVFTTATTGAATDFAQDVPQTLSIDWTAARYFVFALQNASAGDTNYGSFFLIEKL